MRHGSDTVARECGGARSLTKWQTIVGPRWGGRVQQAIGLGGGAALSGLLTMGYLTFVARRLGPTSATAFYAAIFLIFVLVTCSGAINTALTRAVAEASAAGRPDRIAGLRQWFMRRALIGGAGLLLLSVGVSGWTSPLFGDDPTLFLLAMLVGILQVLLGIERSVLRGLQRFRTYSLSILLESAARLLSGLAAVAYFGTVRVAVAPYLMAGLLAFVHARRESVSIAHESDRSTMDVDARPLLSLLRPLVLLALCDAAFLNLDVLFVSGSLGEAEAGLYGAAAALSRLLGLLFNPFIVMAIPLMTVVQVKGEDQGLALLLLGASFGACASLVLLSFAAMPELIVQLIYGEAFLAAAPLLLPHAASMTAGYLSILLCQSLVAVRRFRSLWLYAAGLLPLVAGLAIWNRSALHVAFAMLFVKCALLVALLISWRFAQGERRSAMGGVAG